LEEALKVAVDAVREASEYLMSHFGSSRDVERKESHHSVVSEQDKQSEALLISRLKREFPDHSFIAEETGEESMSEDYVWIIDPLDGSSYYARGLKSFSVSLALLVKWEVKLGVVACPANQEFFCAWKGDGAYLNGVRVQTSKVQRLDDSILSFGHRMLRLDGYDSQMKKLLKSVRSVRAGGSLAQELCQVACGRIEAVINRDQSIWDYAAGKLILEEAGGALTDFHGGQPQLDNLRRRDLSLVASNGSLHARVVEILSQQ
jgi:myo-inositol-1(or 4)-monophosphatase